MTASLKDSRILFGFSNTRLPYILLLFSILLRVVKALYGRAPYKRSLPIHLAAQARQGGFLNDSQHASSQSRLRSGLTPLLPPPRLSERHLQIVQFDLARDVRGSGVVFLVPLRLVLE